MQIESALFCHIFSVQRYEGPDDEAKTSKDCSQLGYPNFLILESNEDRETRSLYIEKQS